MLKRVSKYSLPYSYKENIELISLILEIFDEYSQTVYSQEFYYVYITEEKFSIEDISEIVGVSETSLKDHIRKINRLVNLILKHTKDTKVTI